ncbi:hypothetical protein RUM43_005067, partial [Polyplax serrata]
MEQLCSMWCVQAHEQCGEVENLSAKNILISHLTPLLCPDIGKCGKDGWDKKPVFHSI